MKIRNFVFATVGAASLALVLSACGEPTPANNANTKPVNTAPPVNTSTPANLTPANTPSNTVKPSNTTAPTNTVKPANLTPANGAKPAPTK